jgi:hypothetical protein
MPELAFDRKYLRSLPVYLRHDDFIDGDVDRVRRYLVRHMSEKLKVPDPNDSSKRINIGQQMWNIRNERLANDNLCEPILMHWLAFLTQEISHTDALSEEPWSEFFENLDGFNTPHDVFVREVFEKYLGYGRVGILVEGPADVAEGADEAQAAGERSYATLFESYEIPVCEYWKTGPDRGKVKEVVFILDSMQSEDSSSRDTKVRRYWQETAGAKPRVQEYRVPGYIFDDVFGTTRPEQSVKKWAESREWVPLGNETEIDLDCIPVVIIGDGPRDSILYSSVVPKNRELLNKKSAKDTIDYYQAFKRLAFFGVDPSQAGAWNEALAAFFKEADGKMQEVEAGNPESLTNDIDNIKREAFLDGLLRAALRHQLMTKQVQSVDSKREDNNTLEKFLGSVVDIVERGFNDVVRFMWHFETGSEADDEIVRVTIGRDFKIAFTESELAEQSILVAWLRDFGPAGEKAYAEIVATKLLEQRFAASDREAEDTLKKELADAIRQAAEEGLDKFRRPLRDEGGGEEDDEELVNPQGRLQISSAIADSASA